MKTDKIVTLNKLVAKLELLRLKNIRIVFTNGCFDILHMGHVSYLKDARASGDFLILGLNSDSSVRSIKGDKRPIVSQEQRAKVAASLECVDCVTIFDDPDPLKVIQIIRPDVLVKGADWEEKDIIGADIVKSYGGSVVRIALSRDISTSIIIERIIKRYCN